MLFLPIVQQCLENEMQKRPSSAVLVEELQRIESSISASSPAAEQPFSSPSPTKTSSSSRRPAQPKTDGKDSAFTFKGNSSEEDINDDSPDDI